MDTTLITAVVSAVTVIAAVVVLVYRMSKTAESGRREMSKFFRTQLKNQGDLFNALAKESRRGRRRLRRETQAWRSEFNQAMADVRETEAEAHKQIGKNIRRVGDKVDRMAKEFSDLKAAMSRQDQ